MILLLSGLTSCVYQEYEAASIETQQTIDYLVSRDINDP